MSVEEPDVLVDLLLIDGQISDQYVLIQGFAILNHRTPAFEQGRLNHRDRLFHDHQLVLPGNEADEANMILHVLVVDVDLQLGKVLPIPVSRLFAREHDDKVRVFFFDLVDGFQNQPMVLMRPELVGDNKELLVDSVFHQDLLGVQLGNIRQQGNETEDLDPVAERPEELFEIVEGILATQDQGVFLVGGDPFHVLHHVGIFYLGDVLRIVHFLEVWLPVVATFQKKILVAIEVGVQNVGMRREGIAAKDIGPDRLPADLIDRFREEVLSNRFVLEIIDIRIVDLLHFLDRRVLGINDGKMRLKGILQ